MAGCDVAIIGAGVIGQAIACELVTRGTSVTILDARGAGLGSTQAAAGMLVPYIEGVGHALLPLAAKSLGMYDKFVERLTRDTGTGVDPKDLPHVFDRFYRGVAARQQAPDGSGLGLAIAKAIVERHGGTLEIGNAPSPKTGCIVRVELPR